MEPEILLDRLDIQRVLEGPVIEVCASGRHGSEYALLDALVPVADVLRHQRYQYPALPPARGASEHIEEIEHRALAAVGHGHVLLAYGPSVGIPEVAGDGPEEADASLGRIIMGKDILESVAFGKELLHLPAVDLLDCLHAGRVASAERKRLYAGRKGARDIIHELEYPRMR